MKTIEHRIDLGGGVEAVAELDDMGFWSAYIWLDGEEIPEQMPKTAAMLLFPDHIPDNHIVL